MKGIYVLFAKNIFQCYGALLSMKHMLMLFFPISIKEMDEAHAMQNCNSEIKIFPLFFRKIYGRSATLYPPSLIWRLNQTRAGAGQEIEY